MTDAALLDRIFEKRFWDQAIKDTVWTPEFVDEFFNSEMTLHCSLEYLATATSYSNDLKSRQSKLDIPNISSCVQNTDVVEVMPGVLMSHIVGYKIKGKDHLLELPEVKVQLDSKPYETMLRSVRDNTSSVGKFASDFVRAFGRAMAYCLRLGISTTDIVLIAIEEMGWKLETIERFREQAEKYAPLVTTSDFWLADWVERAAKCCNTQKQIDVLVWVYRQAATYNSRQPRICKKTVSDQLGISRNSVRNLFVKLEQAGLLVEQPEGFRTVDGMIRSEARIDNLDPEQMNRWMFYQKLPAVDRSKAKREKKRKKQALLNAGTINKKASTVSEPRAGEEVQTVLNDSVEISDRDRREYTRRFYDNGGDGLSLEDFIQKCHRESKELDW